MRSFETKFIFDLLSETQTSNRDRFRPVIVAYREAVLQTLLNPLAMRSLKNL